jgi:integrase
MRCACGYWRDQGWLAGDPTTLLRRRRCAPDNSRALPRADVERLLTREDLALRGWTLWRLLYETAARSAEVLHLDVEDLDLPNRRAKVRRKGRRGRRDRVADRDRPAAAPPAQGDASPARCS